MPWWPQTNNGNLVINTIDNFDDTLAKLVDLVDNEREAGWKKS